MNTSKLDTNINCITENLFSIIIPLYNKEKYVERAIKSILNQTYQNFEIIIVNDGSTDNSEKIANAVIDQRITLVRQENQGVSAARNKGVQFAKSNLLAFLDADDVWENTFLENANKLVNQFPEAAIYGLNNFFEYPNGKIVYEKYDWLFEGKETGIIENYFELFLKIGKSPFSNSNYCVKKNIFRAEGGYKVGVKLTEDCDFWCRVALKHDIAYTKIPLATYYLGTLGSTHFIFEPKEFEVTNSLQKALESNHVKSEFKKSVNKFIAFQKLSLIKRSILTGHQLFALKKILNWGIVRFYPFTFFKCCLFILVPSSIVINQRKKRTF